MYMGFVVIDCGFVKLRTFSAKDSIGKTNSGHQGMTILASYRVSSGGANISIIS